MQAGITLEPNPSPNSPEGAAQSKEVQGLFERDAEKKEDWYLMICVKEELEGFQ